MFLLFAVVDALLFEYVRILRIKRNLDHWTKVGRNLKVDDSTNDIFHDDTYSLIKDNTSH